MAACTCGVLTISWAFCSSAIWSAVPSGLVGFTVTVTVSVVAPAFGWNSFSRLMWNGLPGRSSTVTVNESLPPVNASASLGV